MKNFFEKIAANGPLYTAGQIIGLRGKKGDGKETNEIICNRDIDTTVQNGEIDNEKRNEKRDSV